MKLFGKTPFGCLARKLFFLALAFRNNAALEEKM
jgi:hypothetical protein